MKLKDGDDDDDDDDVEDEKKTHSDEGDHVVGEIVVRMMMVGR
jgi:hypothetical protein